MEVTCIPSGYVVHATRSVADELTISSFFPDSRLHHARCDESDTSHMHETDVVPLQNNLRHTQRMVGYRFHDIHLLAKALTAAHRDDEWASDGNRELADIGRSAYNTCIRFSKTDSGRVFRQQAKAWPTLESSHNIRSLCANSGFDLCIAHSPRQTRPLPDRVLRYALWAVIGAVHQDAGGDRVAVCHALNSLCTHLDDYPNKSPRVKTEVQSVPDALTNDVLATAADQHSTTTEEHGGPLTPYVRHDDTINDTAPGSANAAGSSWVTTRLPDGEDMAMLVDDDHKPTSTASKQPCVSDQSSQTSIVKNKNTKRSRPQVHKKMDEYLAHQQALHSAKKNPHFASASPWCATFDQTSQISKNITLRKLCHGPVSSLAIIMCKEAIARRRAERTQSSTSTLAKLTDTSYHYQQINKLTQQHAKDAIKLRWHTYQLYATVYPTAVTDLDAGFVHSDTRTPPAKKRAGNQSNLAVSDAYESIMRQFEPHLAAKPPTEQKRLRDFTRNLRKLGMRLAQLVRRFGPGVLALMPASRAPHPLSLADWELCELPVDELAWFVGSIAGGAHPLGRFAVAAEPLLRFVVGTDVVDGGVRFAVENVDVAGIERLVEGSEELLGLLRTV